MVELVVRLGSLFGYVCNRVVICQTATRVRPPFGSSLSADETKVDVDIVEMMGLKRLMIKGPDIFS